MSWLPFNLPFLPAQFAGDLSLILILVAVGLVFGLWFGRSQLVSITLCAYIALTLTEALPGPWLSASPWAPVTIFTFFLIFLFFAGDYLFDIHISNSRSDFFWRILVMGFLSAGLITSIFLSLLPEASARRIISGTVYGWLAGPQASILWLFIPILFLLFINRRLR